MRLRSNAAVPDTTNIADKRMVIHQVIHVRLPITVLLFYCALSACDRTPDVDRVEPVVSDQSEILGGPLYRKETHISGLFRFDFEISSLVLCPQIEKCNFQTESAYGTGCWLDFNERASADLDEITGKKHFDSGGAYWIEGKGQITAHPGHFGHMGNYECEVMMTTVSEFKRLPTDQP